jgi:hypothetical protein
MPIDRAVDCVADRHPGSNPEARHARGVAGLTQRPLVVAPRPDEDWVIVKYRTIEAAEFDIRLDWTIIGLPPEQNGAVSKVAVRTGLGVDLETDIIQRARRLLFAPHVEEARARIAAAVNPLAAVGGTDSVMPEIFTAREITTEYGKFGHIRIWSFDSPSDSDAFVNEFVRLAELLPQDGLIVDVRDNGGGYITAGEQLLQVLTPHMIKPEGLQFINTAWTLKMCELHAPSTTLEDFDLSPWIPSLRRGAETGATFSASFPISEPEKCNEIGQRYWGPVVLITSARCYSTTDMFAAGFQDHNIGPILGVDANTGAGGANVWEHDLLRYIFDHPSTPPQPLPESPFKSLPNGASMRAAIRRTLRVGPHAGTELEDLGVIPTCLHAMTRADHLSGNVDLLEAAGKLLAKMPKYALVVDVKSVADDEISFELKCQNADLAEVYLDGRPKWTGRVEEGSKITINLLRQGSARVEVQCFKDNKLVSSRRMAL